MTNLRDITRLIVLRGPSFAWLAAKEAAGMADHISAQRSCHVSTLAAFHAIMEAGPYVWNSQFTGAPWRRVSAELCRLGYR